MFNYASYSIKQNKGYSTGFIEYFHSKKANKSKNKIYIILVFWREGGGGRNDFF